MREMVSSRLQTETNKRYRRDDSVTVFDGLEVCRAGPNAGSLGGDGV